MDAIEKAIRSALERGNASDRAFREKVYRQAFAALERALQANPSLTVETAIGRRKALQAKITEIETAYLPRASQSVEPPAPAQHFEPVAEAAPEPAYEPEPVAAPAVPKPEPKPASAGPRLVGGASAPHYQEPYFDDPHDDIPVANEIRVEAAGPTPRAPDIMVETAPELLPPVDRRGPAKPPRRRRPLAGMFIGLTLLCIAAVLGYGAYQMGLFGANSARDAENAAARPVPEPTEPEDFEPGAEGPPSTAGQADAQRNWINVFSASDPATVSAPGDSKAEVMQDSTGSFIRLTSGASGSAILFDVGQGVLEQISGKHATFNIVARALDGQETEMSVACNLGELGDCGRKRYAVGITRADYLFDLDVPKVEPGAGGTIAINSDFANSGKSVDIFEIRVSADSAPAGN